MIWLKEINGTLRGYSFFRRAYRPYFIAIGLTIIAVYSLYIFLPIGTYDDYERAWNYNLFPQTYGRDLFSQHLNDGRAFTGLFLWLFFKPASISYFGIYRIINLLLLIPFSFGIFSFLAKEMKLATACMLTIVICLLPSFSIMFYFVSLMGVFAGGILSRESVLMLKDVVSIRHISSKFVKRIIFACLLLLTAIQFYQPIAMFYWFFAAIILLSNRNFGIKTFLGKVLVYGVVFLFSLAMAYLVMRAAPLLTNMPNRARASLIDWQILLPKILWFLSDPIPNSVNFFLFYSIPKSILICAAVIIFSGIYFWFDGSILRRFLKSFVILMLLPLSYFPNIIVTENWASYRSMIALSALWVILIFFSTKGYLKQIVKLEPYVSKLGRFVLMLWTLLAIILSIYNSAVYLILPAFLEHRIIHSEIIEMDVKAGDTIYVSMPNYFDSSSPYFYGDEFGIPTTAYPWGAANLTKLVLKEFGFSPEEIQVEIINDLEKIKSDEPIVHYLYLHQISRYQLRGSMYPIERVKIMVDAIFQRIDAVFW